MTPVFTVQFLSDSASFGTTINGQFVASFEFDYTTQLVTTGARGPITVALEVYRLSIEALWSWIQQIEAVVPIPATSVTGFKQECELNGGLKMVNEVGGLTLHATWNDLTNNVVFLPRQAASITWENFRLWVWYSRVFVVMIHRVKGVSLPLP